MTARVKIPAGEKVTISHGKLQVPDRPIIAFIEGDGTGPDIWAASVRVLDAAVEQAYKGRRKIAWAETYAGEKAQAVYGADCPPNLLPQETLDVIRDYLVAIKGPLTTPVGEGFRSLNVTLAPGARPLRLPAAGAPLQGRAVARQAPGEDRHGGLPREHGRHLRGHRVARRHTRGQEGHLLPAEGDGCEQDPLPGELLDRHQARLQGGLRAAHPRGDALRDREQPKERHARAQGQHPEVHRRACS